MARKSRPAPAGPRVVHIVTTYKIIERRLRPDQPIKARDEAHALLLVERYSKVGTKDGVQAVAVEVDQFTGEAGEPRIVDSWGVVPDERERAEAA